MRLSLALLLFSLVVLEVLSARHNHHKWRETHKEEARKLRRQKLETVFDTCPNFCSGHGICDPVSITCQCSESYTGLDCSQRVCPSYPAWADSAFGDDLAHARAVCANRGHCDGVTGLCDCEDGFEGAGCQRLTCPNGCSGHGVCASLEDRSEFDETHLDYIIYENWDTHGVIGCICDHGYNGYDCSQRECVYGDDPLETAWRQEDLNRTLVTEIQIVSCEDTRSAEEAEARPFLFHIYFEGRRSSLIGATASTGEVREALMPVVGDVKVDFLGEGQYGACVSASAARGVMSIEFIDKKNDLPPLHFTTQYRDPNTHQALDFVIMDGTDEASPVVAHDGRTYYARKGEFHMYECSRRGHCDRLRGECVCESGFTGRKIRDTEEPYNDCGAVVEDEVVDGCPGLGLPEGECYGHGFCDTWTWQCICDAGWTGFDCSLRSCPSHKSWFGPVVADHVSHLPSECSGRGVCDTSAGVCVCAPGFDGSSCERMSCPGEEGQCSGHGQCLSMENLALESRVNGERVPRSYGGDPRNVNLWDHDMIYGCLCDEGWTGYDCSLRTCPYGDDPQTHGVTEIQTLVCNASSTASGTFRVEFRSEVTDILPVSISFNDFQAALEQLPTIRKVDVRSLDGGIGNVICDDFTDSAVLVEFLTEFGDLPPLRPHLLTSSVSMTVHTNGGDGFSRRGTKEWAECSNRGECDYTTGQCLCYPMYGPSQLAMEFEGRNDCGAVLPHVGRGEKQRIAITQAEHKLAMMGSYDDDV